jgi:hypothetical protein
VTSKVPAGFGERHLTPSSSSCASLVIFSNPPGRRL